MLRGHILGVVRWPTLVKWTRVIPVGLVVGLWSISVPLFASPDEPANFVKGAALVRGEVVGSAVAPELLKSYWTTVVDIDPQFGSVNGLPWCFAPYPDKPACTYDVATAPQVDGVAWTNMGKYPPLGFLLTGLGTVFGPTNLSVYASRFIQSVACISLLLACAKVLRGRDRSMIGFLLAVTPGTIFLASTASPSGLEIIASIAMWVTAPFVLGTASTSFERRIFLVGGVLLIGVRPLGLIFYLAVVAVTMFIGRVSPRAGLQRIGIKLLLTHGAVATFMLWWYFSIYGPATKNKIEFGDIPLSLGQQLHAIVRGLPRIVEQYVGNFGWLDTPAPQVVVWIAVASVLALFVVTWKIGSGRDLVSIVLLLACSTAFTIAADLNYYDLLRTFGSQGRHVAPFLVGIPVLLGARIGPRSWLIPWLGLGWAISVAWSFGVMIRRYSVGVTPGNIGQMWNDPPWVPPLGVSVTLGAMILAVGASLMVLWREESTRH